MSHLYTDTIYQDLKEKGLIFSPPTTLDVPESPPLSKGIMSKVFSAFKSNNEKNTVYPILSLSVSSSAFIIVRQQMLYLYKFRINETNSQVNFSLNQTLTLTDGALSLHSCNFRQIQDRGEIPILVKTSKGFDFLIYDVKEMILREKGCLWEYNALGVGWISDKEFLIINPNQFVHYIVKEKVVKKKASLKLELAVEENQTVKGIWVTGTAKEEKDSLIVVFYAVAQKSDSEINIPMRMKIKEVLRTFEGELVFPENSDFEVKSNSLKYRPSFFISAVGDYYCLQMNHQVLILKKKFDKYMFLDTITQMINGYKIKLCPRGIILSIGSKLIELNCIHFSDPKCASRICDIVEFSEQMQGIGQNFNEAWPIMWNEEFSLIFIFKSDNKLTFCSLIKMEPMKKVLELAKKTDKPVQIIQDLAKNLGICKKDFYLKLWSISKKTNADVYKYLIPCHDVTSIKKQMKSLMRRRTISVSQILKILDKIQQIIEDYLKRDLNQKNLKEYVKNNFLRRKFKLYSMDRMLDYRIFDKIYSSSILDLFDHLVSEKLDPKPVIKDPLHPQIVEEIVDEGYCLETIYQQFKVNLLQDYKQFLRKFLKKFPKKLLDVLKNFNFILPNYPFQIQVQKPSKINALIIKDPHASHNNQPFWFQEITVKEWKAQITKQGIKESLLNNYPTSKIMETIDDFNKSQYGRENKLCKHGLIVLDLEEYAHKISQLKGIQLYLDFCQFANQLAIEEGTEPLGKQIIKILEKKNMLCEPDIHVCKLYASLHFFMMKYDIISGQKLQMSYLTKLKPENLVALFFLEDKQRKQHIFNKFKDLYEDKNQYKQVLRSFVESENCSRIELEILVKEINKKGKTFQEQNQDLIELLIIGVCMKVEIRQNLSIFEEDQYLNDDEQSIQMRTMIDDVVLSKDLALRITRIKQLKKCENIFTCFGLDKVTFEYLLGLEKDNQIYRMLLETFFKHEEKEEEEYEEMVVVLDGEEIILNPRNMLMLLMYLQETVYYLGDPFELIILYGLEMIQWKQFAVIKQILCEVSFLDTLGISPQYLMEVLIEKALESIYEDSQIIYDEETKEQIKNILNIQNIDDTTDDKSPLQITELTKIKIAEIFQSWNLQVKPYVILNMSLQWRTNKFQLIKDIIDTYIDNLNFSIFKEIYQLLQTIDRECEDFQIDTKQLFKLAKQFGQALLKKQRYGEVREVLVYLIDIHEEQIDFVLLTETVMKSILQKFPDDIKSSQHNIDYYVDKFINNEISEIKELLLNNFETELNENWEAEEKIPLHQDYVYSKENEKICKFLREELWKIAKKHYSIVEDMPEIKNMEKQTKNSSHKDERNQLRTTTQKKQEFSNQEICYNYLFLLFGIYNPKLGFQKILGISYNLDKITNILLLGIQNYLQNNPKLWVVNYKKLLQRYFEGLRKIANDKIKAIKRQQDDQEKKNQNDESLFLKKNFSPEDLEHSSIEYILKQLRKQKNIHEKLISSLTKVNTELNNKTKMKARRERYHHKVHEDKIQKQKEKTRIQQNSKRQIVEEKEEESEKIQVFINWRKIEEERKNIQSKSQIPLNEKDVINQIFDSMIMNNSAQEHQNYNDQQNQRQGNILKSLLPLMKNEEKSLKNIKNMIYNNQAENIGQQPLNVVAEAIRQVSEESDIDFYRVLHLMESVKIGDSNKMKIAFMTKVFKEELSNQLIKTIFPFSFLLTNTFGSSEEEVFRQIFQEIRPLIKQCIPSISQEHLKTLAFMIKNILESDEYSAWIYFDTLVWIGSEISFSSSSALLAEDCINGIYEYPEIIITNYQQILNSLTKDAEMRNFVCKLLQKILSKKKGCDEIVRNLEVF